MASWRCADKLVLNACSLIGNYAGAAGKVALRCGAWRQRSRPSMDALAYGPCCRYTSASGRFVFLIFWNKAPVAVSSRQRQLPVRHNRQPLPHCSGPLSTHPGSTCERKHAAKRSPLSYITVHICQIAVQPVPIKRFLSGQARFTSCRSCKARSPPPVREPASAQPLGRGAHHGLALRHHPLEP